jgi:hypothetical protein
MAFCTQCGNQLPEGAKFCVKCGTPVQGVPAVPIETAVPVEAAVPVQAAEVRPEPRSTIILWICSVIMVVWFMLWGMRIHIAWIIDFYYDNYGWLVQSVCAAVCAVLALRMSRRLAAKVLQTLSIIDLALVIALPVIERAGYIFPINADTSFMMLEMSDIIRSITLLVFPIITLVWTFEKKSV